MHPIIYGHTGVVGAQLYRWLVQKGVEVSGVSLDRLDGPAYSEPDWIFLCLPTPTIDGKQDISALTDVLATYDGNAVNVVIRSTVLPGTCDRLQKEHPEWLVFHWPEFLTARDAWHGFIFPKARIIGGDRETWADVWEDLMPSKHIPTTYVSLSTAEIIKYAHNLHGVIQVIYANLLFDAVWKVAANWVDVQEGLCELGYITPDIILSYWDVFKDGYRGFGGNCFPKDLAAFTGWMHEAGLPVELLDAAQQANERLLRDR